MMFLCMLMSVWMPVCFCAVYREFECRSTMTAEGHPSLITPSIAFQSLAPLQPVGVSALQSTPFFHLL